MSWYDNPPSGYKQLQVGEFYSYIHETARISCELTIGKCSYLGANNVFGGEFPVSIGSFVSIAQNIYCFTAESHNIEHITSSPLTTLLGLPLSYSELVKKSSGVIVGDDVYIGEGVRIMPGVQIGTGSVIGARALVTGNLKPYGVYAGVPARLIRYRYSEDVITFLQTIQWWNWTKEKIMSNVNFFNLKPNEVDINTIIKTIV